MGDFLQISQVAVEQRRSNSEEIGVTWVVNLNNTPRVVTGANLTATNLNNILRSDNSKGHKATKLSVLLNSVLVILLNIVGEVVDGNAVVLDILHNKLLGLGKLSGVIFINAIEIVVAPTNSDGLDLNTILNVRAASIIGLLVLKHALSAESVDKGGTAYSSPRGNVPVPEAPQTIRQN
ncbi:hypothetical protein HG531_008765 [Fusarium graminearum]|nr:hypothetical protein HG531_008765 [Fusarium graminearum]